MSGSAWRWSRSAATAGPSWRRAATSTCCSCTTASGCPPTVAETLWYPIWDAKLKLGHAVRTVKEALRLAVDDLDTATVAAVRPPPRRRPDAHRRAWPTAPGRSGGSGPSAGWTGLAARVDERHAAAGEVAFLLEPNLKEGRGGLRDVHALRWAEAAPTTCWPRATTQALREAYDVLLGRPGRAAPPDRPARVTSSRSRSRTPWRPDSGFADADVLMAAVSAAARTIAWISDEAWHRVRVALQGAFGRGTGGSTPSPPVSAPGRRGPPRRRRRPRARPDAAAARRRGRGPQAARIDRSTLDRLAAETPTVARPVAGRGQRRPRRPAAGGPRRHPGPRGARPAGPVDAHPARVGAGRGPSRSATPTTASPSTGTCGRRRPTRPTLADRVAAARPPRARRAPPRPRQGLPGRPHRASASSWSSASATAWARPGPTSTCSPTLVRHHLLLPDVATRRDLSDDGTIERGGRGRRRRRWCSSCSTRSPRPTPWPPARRRGARGRPSSSPSSSTGSATSSAAATMSDATWSLFPSELRQPAHGRGAHDRAGRGRPGHDRGPRPPRPLQPGRRRAVAPRARRPRRPGPLGRAGHGAPTSSGCCRLATASSTGTRVAADLERALAGRLALEARLAERARTYRRRRPLGRRAGRPDGAHRQRGLVRRHRGRGACAATASGVLYRITRAIADLDLDIRPARVQTLGPDVVDAFYVRAGRRAR